MAIMECRERLGLGLATKSCNVSTASVSIDDQPIYWWTLAVYKCMYLYIVGEGSGKGTTACVRYSWLLQCLYFTAGYSSCHAGSEHWTSAHKCLTFASEWSVHSAWLGFFFSFEHYYHGIVGTCFHTLSFLLWGTPLHNAYGVTVITIKMYIYNEHLQFVFCRWVLYCFYKVVLEQRSVL